MFSIRLFVAAVIAMPLGGSAWAASDSWPQFRGPNSSGVAENARPPKEFGPGTNELFRVAVPSGSSSPCIYGQRIFLTAFEDGKLETLCLDREKGNVLWKRAAPAKKIEPFHPSEGSPAASTPATDGDRVYVYFGSCGLIAYNFEGEEVWSMPMEPAQQVGDFGTGTSPIVSGDQVILNRDMLTGSFIISVNARDGSIQWRQERPDFFSSYSTPVVWSHDGRREIIVAASQRMNAYDAKTGALNWQQPGLPSAGCPTPVLANGVLYYAGWSPSVQDVKLPSFDEIKPLDKDGDGALDSKEASSQQFLGMLFTFWDRNLDGKVTKEEYEERVKVLSRSENSAFAVRAPAVPGEKPEIVWKQTRGLPYVPSPLFYRDAIYMVKDGGLVSSYDAKSGEPNFVQERLGAGGSYYSSPVAAEGRVFFVSNDGKVTVVKAGKKLEVVSRCDLGERVGATPALVNDTAYYRTAGHLWAFRQTKKS